MKYIVAVRGSLYALLFFVMAAIFIPGRGESKEVEIILTISTFLFAILAGFYISRFNSRYNEIRNIICSEDASWLSLYKTSVLYGKDFQEKVGDLMDIYYIDCYDNPGLKYYKQTSASYLKLYDLLEEKKEFRGEGAMQQLLGYAGSIEENRNKSSVLELEKLSFGEWLVLFILSGIIIFCIFFLKTNELYSIFVTVSLSSILVLVLLTIRDLQNFRIGGNLMVQESGQENLEFAKRLRYYNKELIDRGVYNIPDYVKEYRLGMHKPGESKEIKVVSNPDYKN